MEGAPADLTVHAGRITLLSIKLEKVLEKNRPELEAALIEAERELADLRRQAAELEHMIIRARAALGDVSGALRPATPTHLTLHEAMLLVLVEHDGPLPVKDLAAEINNRHLYEMRDGRPVEVRQLHARIRNYAHLFDKDGSQVAARHRFKSRSTPDGQRGGAYFEATTEVRDPDGAVMYVIVRVAYQAAVGLSEAPDEFTEQRSRERAVSLLARGRFTDGATDVAQFTSLGWQPVRSELREDGGEAPFG